MNIMENRVEYVKCPYCHLYFLPDAVTIKKAKRNKVKIYTCDRCGNDFARGYYNRKRDSNVAVVVK